MIQEEMMNEEERIMRLAKIAEESILTEAFLYPKPGLVDLYDNGAHKDMDITTFIKSSISLFPGFIAFAEQGMYWEQDEKALFESIRPIGKKIEKEMYEATHGVNTHKGIIFSMGVFLAALSYRLGRNPKITKENLFPLLQCTIRKMTDGLIQKDIMEKSAREPLSNGERAFFEQNFLGIRGEAEKGYPTVIKGSLPLYRSLLTEEMSETERSLRVLLYLIIHTEDTNIVKRGGMKGYSFAKKRAAAILSSKLEGDSFIHEMTLFNEECKEKNLSPGGAADLLSVTYLLSDCMDSLVE